MALPHVSTRLLADVHVERALVDEALEAEEGLKKPAETLVRALDPRRVGDDVLGARVGRWGPKEDLGVGSDDGLDERDVLPAVPVGLGEGAAAAAKGALVGLPGGWAAHAKPGADLAERVALEPELDDLVVAIGLLLCAKPALGTRGSAQELERQGASR